MHLWKVEKNRIQKNPELKPILAIINALRNQQSTLEKIASQKPAHSLEAQKYNLIVSFLTNIDRSIASYNQSKGHEVRDLGLLAIDIWVNLVQLQPQDQQILNTPRNNTRQNTNTLVNCSIVGTGTVVGLAAGGPATAAGSALGSTLASYGLRKAAGLNDQTTYSMQLFNHLFHEIDAILGQTFCRFGYSNLDFTFNFMDEDKPEPDSMLQKCIYIFLNNGSIAYAYKDKDDKIITHNLDNFLDKQKLIEKDSNRTHYQDINQLVFEDYLQDDTDKNNTLDILLNTLTTEQKTIIVGAIYKSFLGDTNERFTQYAMR